MRKISKDDRALITALCQEKTEVHNVCWGSFPRKIGPAQAWTGCWRELILLAWQNVWMAVTVCDQFTRRNFGKKTKLWRSSSAVNYVSKLKEKRALHGRQFGALQSMILGSTSDCQGYCYSLDGTTLCPMVDSNKW